MTAATHTKLMDSLSRDSLTLRRFGSHLSEDELVSQLWTRANELMLKDPERYFPELAGDSVPTARNHRIPASLVIRDIKKDTAWMKNLQCQTVIRNASLNQVLEMEAQNVLNNRPLMRDEQDVITKEVYVESLVRATMEELRNKAGSVERIREKAEKNGRTFEEQLEGDARWVVNDKIEKGIIQF